MAYVNGKYTMSFEEKVNREALLHNEDVVASFKERGIRPISAMRMMNEITQALTQINLEEKTKLVAEIQAKSQRAMATRMSKEIGSPKTSSKRHLTREEMEDLGMGCYSGGSWITFSNKKS